MGVALRVVGRNRQRWLRLPVITFGTGNLVLSFWTRFEELESQSSSAVDF